MSDIDRDILMRALEATFDQWRTAEERALQIVRSAALDEGTGPALVINFDSVPLPESDDPLRPPVFTRPGVSTNVEAKGERFAEDFRDNLEELLDDDRWE